MAQRRSLPLYLSGSALIIFITLLVGIVNNANWIHTVDQRVIAFVTHFHAATLKPLLLVITELGNPSILIVLTMVLAAGLLLCRYRSAAVFTASVGAIMGVLNVSIKYLIQRPRPFIADPQIRALVKASGFSFPSGHSSGTMMFYGTIILLAWTLFKHPTGKWLITILAVLMIGLTGYSRIFVRVHYPTDVFAGFSLGFALLMLSWWFFNPYLSRQHQRKQKADR
ncbi:MULTISPECIES: phosphatase PAP2 family protein [Lacticaseibacillus]|uniref:Phosphatase PAP2 family protein n=2 Tax=Lacticaseibacillus TaxID=2759736 RepID=A0AAN1EYC3_LACCA|nr:MULTISPECIES: phosphatase PAP2 family protein [Lacticaseibacillus]ARY90987.1 phospholipid phosphatase [Lacticaseibacillus casei]KAB1969268.1 phosphatase PAP2 family protein [Lacticaseibacillus casei]WLV81601.1 phosphatase PAP2 family protein [Lacticaseibacillus sp. NCIMB 15473]WNX25552.1 phosphatase PAP2 family protein [Lacticaseibacillus casei]WNX28322.1 phosphatase PAP2 family protein [Lacticaseibacillus casei]